MSLTKNSAAQDNEKRLYLAGWEVTFDGGEECYHFIKTQSIHKKDIGEFYMAKELVFKDNKLSKIIEFEEAEPTERPLEESEIGFEYIESKAHDLYVLEEVDHGKSFLGGKPPLDFKLPTFDFIAPFQYIGMLSKSEPAFTWLPFDLHLVAPIYLDFYNLYIDYSDPNAPKVLDEKELSEFGTAYNELKADSEIIYKKKYIQSLPINEHGGYGRVGVPEWIQYPQIPACPKSGRTMKFICQLEIGPETEYSNVVPHRESFKQYFDHMNFWIDGILYIFFDPESKIACYLIQNS